MPVSGSGDNTGTQHLMATNVTSPINATMANGNRHDMRWHMKVNPGTPTRLATVMPPISTATADAPLPGSASREQTIAPAPKNAPCGKPAINLAANRHP